MSNTRYTKYSNEFKLQVVQEYFNGDLGCRLLAKKYNLPSKNYIANWEKQLKKKGLLSHNSKRKHHKGSQKSLDTIKKTPYELQLERQNLYLKAELAYLKELKKLVDNDKKK